MNLGLYVTFSLSFKDSGTKLCWKDIQEGLALLQENLCVYI